MSHSVTCKVLLTNRDHLQAALSRIDGATMKAGIHTEQMYDGKSATGISINLPGWKYPLVVQESGESVYDNFQGRWGDQSHLDSLVQEYTIETLRAEAATHNYLCDLARQPDGTVVMQMTQLAIG